MNPESQLLELPTFVKVSYAKISSTPKRVKRNASLTPPEKIQSIISNIKLENIENAANIYKQLGDTSRELLQRIMTEIYKSDDHTGFVRLVNFTLQVDNWNIIRTI